MGYCFKTGKIIYLTREDAGVVVRRMKRRRHTHAKRLEPYQCSFCGHIHIGSR